MLKCSRVVYCVDDTVYRFSSAIITLPTHCSQCSHPYELSSCVSVDTLHHAVSLCAASTLLCIPPPPPTTCIITTMHSEATRTDVKLFFSKLLLRPRRGGLLQFWHRPSSSGDYSLLKAILQTIINGHLNKVSPQMVWLAEIPKVPEDKYPNVT